VLDVGCGPGRHAHELARRGIACHGIDISERFVALAREGAPEGATFDCLDARRLPFDAEFDAVLSLCQGAFGLLAAGEDEVAVAGMARALRFDGRLALTAANAYFVVRYHTGASFDADSGTAHERTEVRDETGARRDFDLWTTCYTPRELRLLMRSCGLVVEQVSSVEPGAYGDEPPGTERPELLVIARRPQDSPA
jgi:SAM-dependent methyltransferase